MNRSWRQGLGLLLVAFLLIGLGFVGGHLLDQRTIRQNVVPCTEGPNCVIDQQVKPGLKDRVEHALGIDNLRGALTPPGAFAASSNGHLTSADLSPATGGHPSSSYPGTGQLANNPAAAWDALSVYAHAHGRPWLNSNGPDSMYRPYPRQVYWRSYWCGQGACQNAAVPGTSNHGWGWAVDVDPTTRATIMAYGARFGWSFSCSDAPWESWHVKWCGGWSGQDPGPFGSGGGGTHHGFRALRKGDCGDRVRRLVHGLHIARRPGHPHQRYLGRKLRNAHCYNRFVKAAVVRFQRDHHLAADGIFGLHTHRRLKATLRRQR